MHLVLIPPVVKEKDRGVNVGVSRSRVFSFIFAALFFVVSVIAEAKKSQPIPPPTIVENTNFRSALDSIESMRLSHDYPRTTADPRVLIGDNLIAAACKRFEDFINDTSIPNSDKGYLVARYGMGAQCMVDLLIRAKEAGFAEVILLTDLNRSLNGEFADGEKHNTRFADPGVAFKDSTIARATQALRAAGFRYRNHGDKNAPYSISSLPLYNRRDNNDQIDLMHQKQSFTYRIVRDGDGARRQVVGGIEYSTSNLVEPNERQNRSIVDIDPFIAQHALEHDFLLMETFANRDSGNRSDPGNEVVDIPVLAPLQVMYGPVPQVGEKDRRSSKKILFTDGKYDLNNQMADIFTAAANEPTKTKIVLVMASHFVVTDTEVVESLRNVMAVQKEFPLFYIGANSFNTVQGWGLGPLFDGHRVVRPLGAPAVKGFDDDIRVDSQGRKRSKLFIWQKGVASQLPAEGIDPEGEPIFDHIWHDKTTLIFTEESGMYVAYIFTGSLNCSNHFESAEMQMVYRIPLGDGSEARTQKIMEEAKDPNARVGRYDELFKLFEESHEPILKEFVESIVNDVAANPRHAVLMTPGLFRSLLAQLTGHVTDEIPLETESRMNPKTRQIFTAFGSTAIATDLKGGLFKEALQKIEALASMPTIIGSRYQLSVEERALRLQRLGAFFNWLQGKQKTSLSVREFLGIAVNLAYPTSNAMSVKMALRNALWVKGMSNERIEDQIAEIWQLWQLRNAKGELLVLPPRWIPQGGLAGGKAPRMHINPEVETEFGIDIRSCEDKLL